MPTILATGALPFIRICVIIIFASILVNMISHLITLDVELDASFKRAMGYYKIKYFKNITLHVNLF